MLVVVSKFCHSFVGLSTEVIRSICEVKVEDSTFWKVEPFCIPTPNPGALPPGHPPGTMWHYTPQALKNQSKFAFCEKIKRAFFRPNRFIISHQRIWCQYFFALEFSFLLFARFISNFFIQYSILKIASLRVMI